MYLVRSAMVCQVYKAVKRFSTPNYSSDEYWLKWKTGKFVITGKTETTNYKAKCEKDHPKVALVQAICPQFWGIILVGRLLVKSRVEEIEPEVANDDISYQFQRRVFKHDEVTGLNSNPL